ncbi:MAG: hypothetical protein AAFP90_08125 [Planctomycetota bacterium]
MKAIDLREDAIVFRRELETSVASIVAAAPETLSAIEVGYSCDQSGWIFIHADERPQHQRDGQWTTAIDDDAYLELDHWIDTIESRFEGESFAVTKVDGTRFVVPPFDEDAVDQDDDADDPFVVAIGEMILKVLMDCKADGLFAPLKTNGDIQLDIEDFNGGWAWPNYDDLGKINLL